MLNLLQVQKKAVSFFSNSRKIKPNPNPLNLDAGMIPPDNGNPPVVATAECPPPKKELLPWPKMVEEEKFKERESEITNFSERSSEVEVSETVVSEKVMTLGPCTYGVEGKPIPVYEEEFYNRMNPLDPFGLLKPRHWEAHPITPQSSQSGSQHGSQPGSPAVSQQVNPDQGQMVSPPGSHPGTSESFEIVSPPGSQPGSPARSQQVNFDEGQMVSPPGSQPSSLHESQPDTPAAFQPPGTPDGSYSYAGSSLGNITDTSSVKNGVPTPNSVLTGCLSTDSNQPVQTQLMAEISESKTSGLYEGSFYQVLDQQKVSVGTKISDWYSNKEDVGNFVPYASIALTAQTILAGYATPICCITALLIFGFSKNQVLKELEEAKQDVTWIYKHKSQLSICAILHIAQIHLAGNWDINNPSIDEFV